MRRAVLALLETAKHFERFEYEAALRSFEGVLNCLPEPGADYLAFHAYLLLLNGLPDTLAWEKVVASAQGDTRQPSRYGAAVARYYLADRYGSDEAFQYWREANILQPTRGVAAYIRLPEVIPVSS